MSEAIVRVWRRVWGHHAARAADQPIVFTDFLFAQPSWLSGVARVIDLGASFDEYNVSATPARADARALSADWRVIGQDLFSAARHIYPDFPAPPQGGDDDQSNGRVT